MIMLLGKWLVKSPPSNDLKTRNGYGVLCSVIGILLNLFLCIGKMIAGTVSGSIAITADAFNNLSDAGASVVTLVGFCIAKQKPDYHHPFGHGRMEYIAGFVVAISILLMGFDLLRSSVDKIMHPEAIAFSGLSVAILVASIFVKLYMALYNRSIGQKIGSAAMKATMIDSFSDAVATFVVLLSIVFSHLTGLRMDGWCGMLVSLFILYAGYTSFREMVNPLLGQPPSPELIQKIEEIVGGYADIMGMHDLMVHDYGPGRMVITLHAEVPANGDLLILHDTVDLVEKDLQNQLTCIAVIHMDPMVTDDVLVNETKVRVAEVIMGLDERVTMHDFRMVTGPTHTNVIFDVVVPYDVKATEPEIKKRIAHMVHALDDSFFAVVEVDRPNGI